MKLLNRLERSLGRLAIPRITFYIVFLQSLAFMLTLAEGSRSPEHAGEYISKLELVGTLVRRGEVWRILTFVVIPPVTNPLFFVFAMYLLYLMGTALENHWGTFRYNVYLFVGWLAAVVVSLALPNRPATNAYLMESIFLAFAFLYPDFQLLIFFILPVKVKWLALIVWIGLFIQFTMGGALEKCLVLAAVANFLLFFHKDLWQRAAAGNRRMLNRAQSIKQMDEPFHRCNLCGVSDKSDPKMEFRYCPQCSGTPCYCINHIHSHEHRKSI